MRVHRVLMASILVMALADAARAAQPLSLGPGTACVLMPEREAKQMLGVKKRHVLACAGPTGRIVRVVLTRKGNVECTDAVQVGPGGETANDGTPCKAVSASQRATVPDVVNLAGAWHTNVDSLIGPVVCTSQVVQDGSFIAITATCDIGGQFTGTGSIEFDGFKFDSHGTAEVPIYGRCDDGRMSAIVAPDGQSMSGTLHCGFVEVTFRAFRL
jgi:hypothetical protein